jgi:hypothetical protein
LSSAGLGGNLTYGLLDALGRKIVTGSYDMGLRDFVWVNRAV